MILGDQINNNLSKELSMKEISECIKKNFLCFKDYLQDP